ncbi:MAG: DEAD/DEAH box helicase [Thermincolia bacterium]
MNNGLKKENKELRVECRWEPGQGFLLWDTGDSGLGWTLADLKYKLFAWHQGSFYGTMVPEVEWEGRWYLRLSPLTALEFFAQPPVPEFFTVKWGKEIVGMQQIVHLIQEMLTAGQWRPDYEGWRKGKTGWKLDCPPGLELDNPPSWLDEWVELIIEELREGNAEINRAWAALAEAYPLLGRDNPRTAIFADEEDWLMAIGWKQDHVPFRTCLRLSEPGEGNPWNLNLLLQDKENPDVMREFPPEGREGVADYPGAWLSHLERPAKDFRKWLGYLSWQDNGDEGLCLELTEEQAWEFLIEGSIKLVDAGCIVFLPSWWEQLRKQKPKLRIHTRSSVGSAGESLLGLQQIVRFDWKLAVGELELSEDEFNQALAEKKRLIKIRDQWIQLDPLFLQQVRKIMKQKKKGLSLGEVLQMHLLHEPTVSGDLDEGEIEEGHSVQVEVELNAHLSRMVEQLTQSADLPPEETSALFQGVLRNYQRAGHAWLMFLRRFGLGGCLADDMGLGKTIQWIAYLLGVKEREEAAEPSLLICPTSVMGNWQMELKRFAPSLQVHLHYGPQRSKGEDFAVAIQGRDLVITSYNLAYLDREDLGAVDWNCICLDEAQNIKNAYTKQSAAIRKLTGGHRVALTGTPMENRLTELWSIMDFLNPGYLGSLTAFKRQFVNKIEGSRDAKTIGQVRRLVRPFLLRRVKSDPAIELDLPEKLEFKEYVPLTMEQATLYEGMIEDMFRRLEEASVMERRGIIVATLTRLKQLVNHPALILKEGRSVPLRNRSTKLERLVEMVLELRAEGDRCLIFTQFIDMGHMIRDILQKELGEPALFLYGGTPKAQRDAMIARFQDEGQPGGVFILSLKAGGTGLNLTAANHVFHFDRWWNPAVENQATDRAHRIGQNRRVQVHKFITLGTLEERIDEMLERKQGLNELIVGGGENWITEFNTGELREIFALRREWVGIE